MVPLLSQESSVTLYMGVSVRLRSVTNSTSLPACREVGRGGGSDEGDVVTSSTGVVLQGTSTRTCGIIIRLSQVEKLEDKFLQLRLNLIALLAIRKQTNKLQQSYK